MAELHLLDGQPDGGGEGRPDGRHHVERQRPEAAGAHRLHPPEAHLREGRRRRDRHVRGDRRRRVGPLPAEGVEEGAVLADGGQPELLARAGRDRRGHLPRLPQRRRHGRRAEERRARRRARGPGSDVPGPRDDGGHRRRPGRARWVRLPRAQQLRGQAAAGRVEVLVTAPGAPRPPLPAGDRACHRQRDARRARLLGDRPAGHDDEPEREPGVDPGAERRGHVRLRPRRGEADPRRRGLHGLERRRHSRVRGREHRPSLRDPHRVGVLQAVRELHHGVAEGHRDRHDDEVVRRRAADRGRRERRLRPVRLGLGAVRRPRSDAVLLPVQPGLGGRVRLLQLLQRHGALRPAVRRGVQAAEHGARPREARGPRPRHAHALLRERELHRPRHDARPAGVPHRSLRGVGAPARRDRPGAVLELLAVVLEPDADRGRRERQRDVDRGDRRDRGRRSHRRRARRLVPRQAPNGRGARVAGEAPAFEERA